MRWVLLVLTSAVCLLGQDSSTSVKLTRDVNGNLVQGPEFVTSTAPGKVDVTEKLRSINGNLVPLERVEERVLKNDSSGKVVERVVRKYDQNGQPGPPEKTLIEEENHPEGKTVHTTTLRGDISGNLVPFEKSVTQTQKNGSNENSESVVERQTLNGFQTVEKKSVTKVGTKENYEEKSVTYRNGQDGFYPAVTLNTSHSTRDGVATDNTAEYEVGSSGGLEAAFADCDADFEKRGWNRDQGSGLVWESRTRHRQLARGGVEAEGA